MSDQPPVNVNVNQPEPSFPVTLSAVYYELLSLSSKFDALAALPHEVNDHEGRLRALESEQARAYKEIDRAKAAADTAVATAKATADNTYVTKNQARWALGTLIAVVMATAAVLGLIIR